MRDELLPGEVSLSYFAFLSPLSNVRKHPDADRLVLADCFGETVIVSAENHEGELGVYFPCGGRLSEAFCQANDLIRRKDENGNPAGGFFEESRKIRAQKFRGVISNGFWCPISYFDSFVKKEFWDGLPYGYHFDTLDGIRICEKYLNAATRVAGSKNRSKVRSRSATPTFPMHFETKQLRYFIDQIPVGSKLSITIKAHGTSGRVAHVVDSIELPRWKQWVNKLYPVFPTEGYRYLSGSRRVILTHVDDHQCAFHSEGFRDELLKEFYGKLHKDEMVFFEAVGYEPTGKPIMPAVDTTKLADKNFSKKYGKSMVYDYGCQLGQFKILIYRIAVVTPDGFLVDLPWEDVKVRSAELGMAHVVEAVPTFIYDGNATALMGLVESHMEGTDPLGDHWREGVCVRVDSALSLSVYKAKNKIFGFLEQYVSDDPTVIDTEDAA